MPSKKRSLKPVNRGFATTSVQKKPNEQSSIPQRPNNNEPPQQNSQPPSTPAKEQTSQSQQQVDSNSDSIESIQQFYQKVFKEVDRNLKLIEYERKLTKTLPNISLNDINFNDLQLPFNSDDSFNDNNDKILLKLAINFNTLLKLGFNKDFIIDSIKLTNSLDLQNNLIWLAFNCSNDQLNLTSYSTIPPSPPKPLDLPSFNSNKTPTSSSTPSKSKPFKSLPQSPKPIQKIHLTDDDELDPTNTYVKFKIQLDETERAAGIVKKKGKKSNDSSIADSNPDILALKDVVNKLQGMYLFDKKEADTLYRNRRSQLDKELLQERLKQPQQPQPSNTEINVKENKESKDDKDNKDNNDDDNNLGDLFNEDTEKEELTSDGKPIQLRDLTLPRQISQRSMPKYILEESITKIDKSSQCYINLISKNSRLSRASGLIQWGAEQSYAQDKFEMSDIGCSNELQAINYVALVLLHKVYVKFTSACTFKPSQFPNSFGQVWNELEEDHKNKDNEKQMEQYKFLKLCLDNELKSTPIKQKSNTLKQNNKNDINENNESNSINKTSKPKFDSKLQNEFKQRVESPSYKTMLNFRNSLPIASYRNEILSSLNSNQVIVLSGETGCGKSTQLPSFILEDCLSKGENCKIYCTEPRRISAISLGSRVSVELGEKPGSVGTNDSVVGYAVRLENHISKSTKLIYATNGIALRMLESGSGADETKSGFDEITHIIIDEVHERSIESDFLLIVLKSLIEHRKDLKIVLMSATIESEKLSNYFNGCPIIKVPGRTYPVDVNFLEDAIEFSGYKIDETSPYALNQYDAIANKGKSQFVSDWNDNDDDNENENDDDNDDNIIDKSKLNPATSKYSPQTYSTLNLLNEYLIPYDLIIKILEKLCSNESYQPYSKATLIFMSGMSEIRKMNDLLQEHTLFGDETLFEIYPLHSSISTDKQSSVFDILPEGKRKIVIATNIAETGITIPDVTCVIDTGRHREMRFDEKRQISRLLNCFIAKSNATQRRGRAGRVQNGLCFHLFTKDRFDNKMSVNPLPEMTRLSLQDLALRIKIMNFSLGNSIENVLSRALDPPTSINIQRAISSLIEVKALKLNEDITPMGRLLSRLPVDVHIGKFLLNGVLFGCLDSALTIAATLNSKSPFVSPFGFENESMVVKSAFNEGNSDFMVIVKAFSGWRQSTMNQGYAFMKKYCQQNFLSLQNLQQIEELRVQLLSYLVDASFVTLTPKQLKDLNASRMVRTGKGPIKFFEIPPELNVNGKNSSILHAAIASGLFPKIISMDYHTSTLKTISNNASVAIHPSSPNAKLKWQEFNSSYLCYFTLLQSKKLYAHEVAPVDLMSLILLCGDMDLKIGSNTIQIHNKVKATMDFKTCALVASIRDGMQSAINAKIRGKEWNSYQNYIFDLALNLINNGN